MAGGIVEHPQALCKATCLPFKDANGLVDLLDKILACEVAITIFARFDNEACLPIAW
jgi:hypothetical protein